VAGTPSRIGMGGGPTQSTIVGAGVCRDVRV
jgi:hypothetical protein